MTARPRSSRSRPARAAALLPVVLAALTGCTGGSPEVVGTSAPEPGRAALDAVPLEVPCDELVDATAVAATWPGLRVADDGAAAEGVPADVATIGELDGTVCSYVAADGTAITVAVAELEGDGTSRVGNRLVTTLEAVPTYGVEGYFTTEEDGGTAEALSEPWWVVTTSPGFVEPGDAEQVVGSALAALGARTAP